MASREKQISFVRIHHQRSELGGSWGVSSSGFTLCLCCVTVETLPGLQGLKKKKTKKQKKPHSQIILSFVSGPKLPKLQPQVLWYYWGQRNPGHPGSTQRRSGRLVTVTELWDWNLCLAFEAFPGTMLDSPSTCPGSASPLISLVVHSSLGSVSFIPHDLPPASILPPYLVLSSILKPFFTSLPATDHTSTLHLMLNGLVELVVFSDFSLRGFGHLEDQIIF